jgi:decaprenylphospho-beta-D-ribofuranose 2-oxidase
VTLGGAVAADIHGKNHLHDGSLAAHVRLLTLRTADEEVRTVDPVSDHAIFRATVGGMGLTGLVETVTVQLIPVDGPQVTVDTQRTKDFDDTLQTLSEMAQTHRYSVAWLDALHSTQMGRGIVEGADHTTPRGVGHRPLGATPRFAVPAHGVGWLLRASTVRAYNELHWRTAPENRVEQIMSMDRQFFPLDGIRAWNRLYGRAGLLQYQFAVPPGAERVMVESLERLRARRVPVYLAVLKRLGAGGTGMLSFPIEGWTLALDVPARARNAREALDGLDDLVAERGGRVYLAKDARLRPDRLRVMYPELDAWLEVRSRLDPHRTLQSDLARRLGLTNGAGTA